APTITEAVYARYISAMKAERVEAARILAGPAVGDGAARAADGADFSVEDIGRALYAAKICSYAQGFALLKSAAREYGWALDLGLVSSLWRGGCIIRAQFLDRIRAAYRRDEALSNLLLDPYFAERIDRGQESWRKVTAAAALRGLPIPGFSSALNYYD